VILQDFSSCTAFFDSFIKCMDQLLASLKDYTAIVVALLAAAVSIINLICGEKSCGREINRFSELEDTAGQFIEDSLSYNIRSNEERLAAQERLQSLRATTGRFLRYPAIAAALSDVTHSISWHISQDMKMKQRPNLKRPKMMLLTGSTNSSPPSTQRSKMCRNGSKPNTSSKSAEKLLGLPAQPTGCNMKS
jgi:hypothetical protein